MAETRHLIRIKSTPEKIYRAIVAQDGLANWWTYDTKIVGEADKVGSIIEFGFTKISVSNILNEAETFSSNKSL